LAIVRGAVEIDAGPSDLLPASICRSARLVVIVGVAHAIALPSAAHVVTRQAPLPDHLTHLFLANTRQRRLIDLQKPAAEHPKNHHQR
jgi:hypothetical protein